MPTAPPTSVFVIRVWWEWSLEKTPRWRGRIKHLQSGKQQAFEELEQIADFLRTSGAVDGSAYQSENE